MALFLFVTSVHVIGYPTSRQQHHSARLFEKQGHIRPKLGQNQWGLELEGVGVPFSGPWLLTMIHPMNLIAPAPPTGNTGNVRMEEIVKANIELVSQARGL